MTGYGLHIFPQHAALLAASAISPEVSRERGLRVGGTEDRLQRAGFERSQCVVPGLLIPLYGADGSLWRYQNRPDNPRLDNGKARQVRDTRGPAERPGRAARRHGQLADPDVPLWSPRAPARPTRPCRTGWRACR